MNDAVPESSAPGPATAVAPLADDGRGPVASVDVGCPVPQAAADRLAYLLVALGSRLGELAEAPLAELGLDGHDYSVLAILAVDGPGSQHEIAKLMNKAPGVIVAAVDQLEAKGYVERQRDPADRRRSRVTPTAAGIDALTRADGVGVQLVAEALPGLDAAEVATLQALLQRGLGLTPA